MRRTVAGLVVLALGGCGGDVQPRASSASQPPSVVRFCSNAGPGWTALEAGGVDAAVLGKGSPVVLLNQSDNDACAWLDEASSLAAGGYRVAVFSYASTIPDDEDAAVDDALAVARALGSRVQLAGASLGGRIVFEAAARAPDQVTAIASLSGERAVEGYRDILDDVRRVTVPVLYLGSRMDPLTRGTKQPRQIEAALPSKDATFQLVPGSQHGVLLLPALSSQLRDFLDAHR